MELVVGAHLVQMFEENERFQWLWILANQLFAILVLAALLSHSALGLPLFVMGMFKLGFPEIVSHLHRSTQHKMWSSPWFVDFLNGCGTLFHHSAACWLVVAMVMRLYSVERFVLVVGAIVLLQHSAVMLKFLKRKLYVFTVLFLEIWFQIESIGSLNVAGRDFSLLLAMMLLIESHWFFFTAAGLEALGYGYKGQTKSYEQPEDVNWFTSFVLE